MPSTAEPGASPVRRPGPGAGASHQGPRRRRTGLPSIRFRPAPSVPSARERGSVPLYLIIIAMAVMAMLGLVVDGGNALSARGRAADLAAQAARAGADAISQQSLRAAEPSDLQIDPVAARQAAMRLLAQAGATGTLTVTGPDSVRVSAHVRQRTAIMSVFGIDDVSGTASASAVVLHGVRQAQP